MIKWINILIGKSFQDQLSFVDFKKHLISLSHKDAYIIQGMASWVTSTGVAEITTHLEMYGSNINLWYLLHDLYIDIVWNEHSEFFVVVVVIVASKELGRKYIKNVFIITILK